MSEKKKDEKKDDPPQITLKTEYLEMPLYWWIGIILSVITVIILIIALTRRR